MYKELTLGLPDIGVSDDQYKFPLFPLAVVSDIPFLLTGGYLAGGQGMPPKEYLDWCAQYCLLREELVPADNPVEAADMLLRSSGWLKLNPTDMHFTMIRQQALRMLPLTGKDEKWLVRWDKSTQQYILIP
jgi:hypothetical protein